MASESELINTIQNGKPCFIIGNGINIFNTNDKNENNSWGDILLKIYKSLVDPKVKDIPNGISMTEYHDLIDLHKSGSVKESIQKKFVDNLKLRVKSHHEIIVNKIRKLDCPILTTNFDLTLENCINAEMFRYKIPGKRVMTDYYPWDSYYSNHKKENPFSSFSIWHMHGQTDYERSIKLGLNQYLLMVDYAKQFFPSKNNSKNENYETWLKIFFERDLIIFGLGLEEQEVFIRWLLLKRAKYFKYNKSEKKLGYYINHDEISDRKSGKNFFLNSVGIKYVNFIGDYDKFYKDFWSSL